MKKKKISKLSEVEDIIIGEGSWASNGIEIKCKSEIPLFFNNNKIPEFCRFEGLDYESAVDYIKKVLDSGASYYDALSFIEGKYSISGRKIKEHNLNFNQYVEILGFGRKNKSKILDVSVSFEGRR